MRYAPTDRLWFATLSSLIPRRCWAEIFPVSPATLPVRHRRLVARKWGPSWKQFFINQVHAILVIDFVHIDAIGLKRLYAMILVQRKTRRAHLAGVTANPTGERTRRRHHI